MRRRTLSRSLIYRSEFLYSLLIRLLYGRHVRQRLLDVARWVPEGGTVLELCCGPAMLYRLVLRHKASDYLGWDINEMFITSVRRAGGRGLVCNLRDQETYATADVVIMQASLYHFLPDVEEIVTKMIAAAGRRVIIAEPIRNITTDGPPLLRQLARRLTNPGTGDQPHRFNEHMLDQLLEPYQNCVVHKALIAGGREKLYVLDTDRGNTE